MRRVVFIAWLVISCASGLSKVHPPCTLDADCTSGQICFPDGCADPGTGLVAEVTGNPVQGFNAQDFELGDAGFAATEDFQLRPAMTLSGHFQQNVAKPVPYTGATALLLTGQSALIPGVNRTYQASFIGSDQGEYSLPVGSGVFNTFAICNDTSVPPARNGVLTLNAGDSASLDFQFYAPTATIILTGHVIKRTEQTIPPQQINLTAAQEVVDIIAIDPSNQEQQPLSQLTHVSSGLPISDGSFQIFIDPSAKTLTAINLVVSPHDPNSLMPSKTFTLIKSMSPTNPYPTGDQLVLEMGAYGDGLPTLSAADGGGSPRILTSDGLPVANAVVSMSGPVTGGGTFDSVSVKSDMNGAFSIGSLPSDPRQSFTMTVVPPTSSPAAITKRQVDVFIDGGIGQINPGDIYCDDKVTLGGTLLRPDGTAAANVLVTAVPISALPDDPSAPLPTSSMQTNTDASGNFTFLLDPRVWRLDFTPGEALPITSRVVHVRREYSADAGGTITPIDLHTVVLHKGRQVSGHVSLPDRQGGGPAQFSSVRFFHVDSVEQQASSVLIGQAVCDEQGNYTVVLPTAN